MCTCEIVLEDRVCDHTEKCLSFADWYKLYHFQVKIYILPQQAVSRIIIYVPTCLSMMLIAIQSFHVNGIDLNPLDLATDYLYSYYFTGTFWSLRSNSSYSFEARTLKFST